MTVSAETQSSWLVLTGQSGHAGSSFSSLQSVPRLGLDTAQGSLIQLFSEEGRGGGWSRRCIVVSGPGPVQAEDHVS